MLVEGEFGVGVEVVAQPQQPIGLGTDGIMDAAAEVVDIVSSHTEMLIYA